MKSYRNKVIQILMSVLQVILLPLSIRASPYEEQAREAVKFQHQNLERHVLNMLDSDFNFIMATVFDSHPSLKSLAAKQDNLDARIKHLVDGFTRLGDKQWKASPQLLAEIQAALDAYSELYRQTVDLSFVPSRLGRERENLIGLLQNIVQSYATQCATGRNEPISNINLSEAPPQLHFSFFVSIGMATPNSSEVKQYNYNHPDAENVLKVAPLAAGLSYSNAAAKVLMPVMETGKILSWNQMSTAAKFGVKAAVVVAAIIVVVAVLNYFHGVKKRNELMKAYFKGEQIKILEGVNSADVNRVYRERCKQIAPVIEEFSDRFAEAIKIGSKKYSTQLKNRPWKSLAVDSAGLQLPRVELSQLNAILEEVAFFTDYSNQAVTSEIFQNLVQLKQRALIVLQAGLRMNQKIAEIKIDQELAAGSLFDQQRSQFSLLVSQAIQVIFGRRDPVAFSSELSVFRSQLEKMTPMSTYHAEHHSLILGSVKKLQKLMGPGQ